MKPPDVLVLGAGGTLGEAWLSGFLAGVGQQGGIGFRQSAHFAGTSAGSIVTARLASGQPPRVPEETAGLVQQVSPASASSARVAPALRHYAGDQDQITTASGACCRNGLRCLSSLNSIYRTSVLAGGPGCTRPFARE